MYYPSQSLKWLIALVWLTNGLFCKVLNWEPRHQDIVANILGDAFARELTIAIGLAEIGMFVWVVSGIWPRWCAYLQIAVVITMNIIELALVPDLLLWGRFNLLFAILFCVAVAYNEYLRTKLKNA